MLLYYDGQRCLVSALRTLVLAQEGRTWTLDLAPDLIQLTNNYVQKLVEENLTNKILSKYLILTNILLFEHYLKQLSTCFKAKMS